MNSLEECSRDLLPFFIQRNCRSLTSRSPVPVISIPLITFLAVEVSMDVRRLFIRQILNTSVRRIPLAKPIMPHGL